MMATPPFNVTSANLFTNKKIKVMQTEKELNEIILDLAKEKGYPATKLDFQTYIEILREAHRIKYGNSDMIKF